MTAIIAGKSAVCCTVKMASTISHIHVNADRETEREREGGGQYNVDDKMCNFACLWTRKVFIRTLAYFGYSFICFLPSVDIIVCHFSSLLQYQFALYTSTAAIMWWVKERKLPHSYLRYSVLLLTLVYYSFFLQWSPLDVKPYERLHDETVTKWNQMSWYVVFRCCLKQNIWSGVVLIQFLSMNTFGIFGSHRVLHSSSIFLSPNSKEMTKERSWMRLVCATF